MGCLICLSSYKLNIRVHVKLGRRQHDHSRDSRYSSSDASETAADLRFPNSSSRFHAAAGTIYHQPRSHHHHSRSGIYQHAPSRHFSRTARGTRLLSRAERGRSCTRHAVRTRRVSISISPSANLQGNNSATRASFYVTNLPEQALYVDIRKAFEVCGILSDVYVARNRNARGQNHGFLRFINVKDVAKLQKALNNVYFGQNKVWANVARFDRFGEVKRELLNEWEDGKKSAAVGGKNKSKINAEEGKKESIMGGKNKSKNSEIIFEKEKINEGEKNNDGGIFELEKEDMALARKRALEQVKLNAMGSEEEREQVRLSGVAGDTPYVNFFTENKTSNVGTTPKVIGKANVTRKFHSDNEDVIWASKGALAKVRNGDFIPIVQQKIIDAGFDNVRVVPRGGDNVILFCAGKEDMMSVYLAAADFFNCFFTDMRAWSPTDDNVPERGVWLRIYGIPLHVWHIKFLEFISSSCGRILKIDPCTTNLERLDFARILVSTECLDTINAVENILIDDKHHIIKFVEEIETGVARDVCFEEVEGEKNHKKGGLNCVFGNFFFYVLDNCPQVQSLK